MNIFIAALATETNTFSPIPTGEKAFLAPDVFMRNDGSRQPPRLGNIPLIEWRRLAEADGHTISESICTFAQPAGPTVRRVYEHLRDMLLADLQAAMPVDVVLLFMHGAMVADGYDDCEGDTLQRVRALVGPDVAIGIELDLHCHLTETMRANADVLITFKQYPHTDIPERARELYPLCVATRSGEIAPVIAYHDCRMISMWRTPVEPLRSFIKKMQALEGKDGILSVSFGHGFPWGDVPDVGAKIVVVADADRHKAADLARRLGDELWQMRVALSGQHDTIDEGLDAASSPGRNGPLECFREKCERFSRQEARQNKGLESFRHSTKTGTTLVLADIADNAGGGAPSDNTAILRRLVDRHERDVATGCYWDPVAVQLCQEAGVGATFDLRIGGKLGIASGEPVDLKVTVKALSPAHSQFGLSGGRSNMGASAYVEADGIHIILMSIRQQTFAPDAFTGLGCALHDKRIVVVKSTQHFYAAFEPLAGEIRYVTAPGAIAPDFDKIPYTKLTKPYWPRVADPFTGTNQP